MIFLRKVQKEDIEQIFAWANDPDARNFSTNTKLITWDEHIVWFEAKLHDINSFFYILTDDKDSKMGTIRFDRKGNQFILSYSIAKAYRGQGLGAEIITLGLDKLKIEVEISIEVIAFVKDTNAASFNIFSKLHFEKIKEELINNELFFIFEKHV